MICVLELLNRVSISLHSLMRAVGDALVDPNLTQPAGRRLEVHGVSGTRDQGEGVVLAGCGDSHAECFAEGDVFILRRVGLVRKRELSSTHRAMKRLPGALPDTLGDELIEDSLLVIGVVVAREQLTA